ncbi:alpha/beta fold hydrolase [Roseateles violae]|uniref:Cholesterol oxidase n=1 Tax=Roseateles violae TaxID=3058042 RepID=A0ABT8DYJ9_9BURK|nr:alpha/beta fold hydrolase [Pelomonas sp. PFR6]MDN3922648.1 alpha/beta fold hydrolase [Pelomonas sp. PFR6]
MQTTANTWLSEGAEQLAAELETGGAKQDGEFDCDILIVGSGYGGAVAAARLAGSYEPKRERCCKVWLLERGSEHLPGSFPSQWAELPGQVRFSLQDGGAPHGMDLGLFDLRIGADVSALLANGLGGGSLINAGVMRMPPATVFRQGWPEGLRLASLREAFRAAKTMLNPRMLPEGRSVPKLDHMARLGPRETLAGRAGAAANEAPPPRAARLPLTVHFEPGSKTDELPPCTLCGDCMTGCNQGAKLSLDLNYLRQARQAGARLFCGGAVEYLEKCPGGWIVHWHYTDTRLRPADGHAFKLRARRVVLAAGTLGSTEILLRSRERGLPLSARLGSAFSCNGDRIAAAYGNGERIRAAADPQTDPAEERDAGPTILGIVNLPDEAAPGYVLEDLSVPGALRPLFGEIVFLLARLLQSPERRDETMGDSDDPVAAALTEADIDRMSLYAFVGPDAAAGTLRLPAPPGRRAAVEAGLRIDWAEPIAAELPERLRGWLQQRLDQVGGGGGTAVSTTGFNIGRRNLVNVSVTVHPLGGCRMGDDAGSGVVDRCGRVFDPTGDVHEGLAVLDGSIVPTALGINPAFTITALAEHAAPQLREHWGLAQASIEADLPDRPRAAPRRIPPPRADWQLSERLQGRVSFDAGRTHFWAGLEIEFETIPGLHRALQQPDGVLKLRRGTLTLHEAGPDDDEFSIAPSADTLVCSAELGGQMLFFAPGPAGCKERMSTLVYRLSVQGIGVDRGGPLRINDRLEGIKLLGLPPEPDDEDQPFVAPNPLRQLSELTLRHERQPIGRLTIDLAFLAAQREPLLSLLRASNLVDALVDLGSSGVFVLRRLLMSWIKTIADLGDPPGEGQAQHLDERYPGPVAGAEPEVIELDGRGARLTHYKIAAPCGAPLLLIHGLGVSGSIFSHPSIPHSLLSCLHEDRRDVWILDLSSSIGNEWGRQKLEPQHWSTHRIAQVEIPAAIDCVLARSGQPRLDVFAHCMGGLMFCMATLNDLRLAPKIRAAVLSQTGPLPRLSPYNRFRAFVVGALEQMFEIDELDACPDYQATLGTDGRPVWQRITPRPSRLDLADAMLALFPYPDNESGEDSEAMRQRNSPVSESDFLRIRHRADGIFGQLFELPNVADSTLACLDALFGWVKVPILLQAIQFTRYQLLTDSEGRNRFVHEANLAEGFGFPVLFIHGQRNRVFDWQGSLNSLQLLQKIRGEPVSTAADRSQAGRRLYGEGATQLAVFERYGHLDCIFGKDIRRDIYPSLRDFLDDPKLPRPGRALKPLPPLAQLPALGPMLGWLRPLEVQGQRWLQFQLLVHPAPQAPRCYAVAVVPVLEGAPQLEQARLLPWPGDYGQVLTLQLLDAEGRPANHALLTLHADQAPTLAEAEPAAWLAHSSAADAGTIAALRLTLLGDRQDMSAEAQRSVFTLTARVAAAADRGGADTSAPLSFALASCQYPPTLIDEQLAGASYARLAEDAQRADGPQLLLLAGDQVYIDAGGGVFSGASSPSALLPKDSAMIARSYELSYGLPAMRRTTARLPSFAMLDDHEVGNDWPGLAGAPELPQVDVGAALQAFGHFQRALGPYGERTRLGGEGSQSYVFHPAGHPVFVLDTRIHREARSAATVGRASLLRADVMAALLAGLKSAPAQSIKFILSPSPLLPPERFNKDRVAERLHSDTGSGFPCWTATLLNFIHANAIERVVLLSGDSHLSSVCEFEFEPLGSGRVIGIVSSALYAPWPFANQRPDELVLGGPPVDLGPPGTPCVGSVRLHAMSAANGYALLRADAQAGLLTVSLRSADGSSNSDCEFHF